MSYLWLRDLVRNFNWWVQVSSDSFRPLRTLTYLKKNCHNWWVQLHPLTRSNEAPLCETVNVNTVLHVCNCKSWLQNNHKVISLFYRHSDSSVPCSSMTLFISIWSMCLHTLNIYSGVVRIFNWRVRNIVFTHKISKIQWNIEILLLTSPKLTGSRTLLKKLTGSAEPVEPPLTTALIIFWDLHGP